MSKPEDKESFIALDDLTVLDHDCEKPIDCDFENNRYCSYSPFYDSSTEKDYHFSVFTTPTDDSDWPGPNVDHTTGNYDGGYLFMTAYRSNFGNLTSKMISGSRRLDKDTSYCLSLWTVITSAHAQMVIYIVRYGDRFQDSNRTVQVLQVANVSEDKWTRQFVTLSKVMLDNSQEIQVIFEGRIKDSRSLIAIDDIELTSGDCEFDGVMCANGIVVPPSKVCDFVKDCDDGLDEYNCGSCDFETDSCGWNDKEDKENFGWQRKTAYEVTDGFIITDASHNKSGHFLAMKKPDHWDVDPHSAEVALNYKRPQMYLKQSYKHCVMRFYLFLRYVAPFYIQIRIGEEILDMNTVYFVEFASESPQNGWIQHEAHIGQRYTNFISDIKVYQRLPLQAFTAVDNIEFVNCSMPKPLEPSGQCPGDKPIVCPNTRLCIHEDEICDNVNDCVDEWDESNCSDYVTPCSFDSKEDCALRMNNTSFPWAINGSWVDRNSPKGNGYLVPRIDNTQ